MRNSHSARSIEYPEGMIDIPRKRGGEVRQVSCRNLGQDVVQYRVMIERGESLEMRASPEHCAGNVNEGSSIHRVIAKYR